MIDKPGPHVIIEVSIGLINFFFVHLKIIKILRLFPFSVAVFLNDLKKKKKFKATF